MLEHGCAIGPTLTFPRNIVDFTLEPQGDATTVTWAMRGAMPYPAKIMHLIANVDRMVLQMMAVVDIETDIIIDSLDGVVVSGHHAGGMASIEVERTGIRQSIDLLQRCGGKADRARAVERSGKRRDAPCRRRL